MTPGLPELLALVLGGGGLAAIQGAIRAVAAYRDGARARERDVLADSESWRRAVYDDLQHMEDSRDWWRQRAAELWQQCVEHGGHPGPLGSPPPRSTNHT
ncbi:hypothetical protein ACFW4K_26890 [Nocardiopsis alba]|uniref:hypothetical protein n=1 Tax=Nocardiopsis alba TaxID=53437 RepID=UPI003670A919